MQKTNISWATHTWNPITGCSPCSPGCANCYAKDLHDKRHKAYLDGKKVPACYAEPFDKIKFHPERLGEPMSLKKPATIFVCSMGDLGHPEVKDEWISDILATATKCPQHTFMILTKRPERIHDLMQKDVMKISRTDTWPIRNVWIGVTVCNQAEADEKIPILLQTPAAHRFVSIEPMLGEVDIEEFIPLSGRNFQEKQGFIESKTPRQFLDFVIVGGETGKNARPMHPDWVHGMRQQCQQAGVPFHFKNWGEWVPRSACYHRFENGQSCSQIDPSAKKWPCFRLTEQGLNGNILNEEVIAGNDFYMQRVGAKRAGHLLDGVEYRDTPNIKA